MPDKPRTQMSPFKFAGIHGRIADDVYKDADYELRCRNCDNNFPLPEYRFGEFLAKGWPKCCGNTMTLNKFYNKQKCGHETHACCQTCLNCFACCTCGAKLDDSKRERPIKGFTKTGRPKLMSKAEEKAWRKSIKTVIREEEVGDAKP